MRDVTACATPRTTPDRDLLCRLACEITTLFSAARLLLVGAHQRVSRHRRACTLSLPRRVHVLLLHPVDGSPRSSVKTRGEQFLQIAEQSAAVPCWIHFVLARRTATDDAMTRRDRMTTRDRLGPLPLHLDFGTRTIDEWARASLCAAIVNASIRIAISLEATLSAAASVTVMQPLATG